MPLTNRTLAEVLAQRSEDHEGNKQRALRRAARYALMWPIEVVDHVEEGEALASLPAVGPWVARQIEELLAADPAVEVVSDLRADFRSFAEARARVTAAGSWRDEMKGDLQMHTVYSDGGMEVAEVARLALELGYEYIAITDHSKGLKIAGGMDEAQLVEQGAQIDEVNDTFLDAGEGFRILRALEMNLSPDGDGDMDPEALDALDLVLGSFHSQLRRKEDQTERYIAGLRNPHVNVLGHPRGRMWNSRLGLLAEWPRVFDEAARLDKAVEIDAHPNRQDLNVSLLELARDAGCRISIGTDAHYPHELSFIDLGSSAALEAGIPRGRIINFLPADELVTWARGVRTG